MNPLQNLIGCGCSLTVDVEAELRRSNFRIASMNKYYVDNAPRVIAYMYEGVGLK